MSAFIPITVASDFLTYNMIERGTIMLFTLALLVACINIGIQFCKGTLDHNLLNDPQAKYRSKPQQHQPPAASGEDLVKEGRGSQIVVVNKIGMISSQIKKPTNTSGIQKPSTIVEYQEQQETICDKIQKNLNLFNYLFAIMVFWLLTFVTGTNYPFAITLFFIVLAFMIVFNVIKVHRMCCQVAFLWALFESLWLIAAFWWSLNIWTIANRIWQPYYLIDSNLYS